MAATTEASETGFFPGGIEIIPNGVETAHFRSALDAGERNRPREKLGSSEAGRVVVTGGAVSPREGNELLRASNAFRFASHREGFPNAILEALVSGLAAVSTRFIEWSDELGEPGRHYLLAEHDPRSLAGAVS